MAHDPQRAPFWRSRFGLGWGVLAVVAAWFLWEEHRAHVLGVLPYLFLLACPLMHVFMHGGHHHHHHHPHGGAEPRPQDEGDEGRRP